MMIIYVFFHLMILFSYYSSNQNEHMETDESSSQVDRNDEDRQIIDRYNLDDYDDDDNDDDFFVPDDTAADTYLNREQNYSDVSLLFKKQLL